MLAGGTTARKRRAINLSCVYMFFFSLRFTEAFWVIYLRSKGLSFAMIGLMETVFHLSSLAAEVPTGWLADRFGRKASLLMGRCFSILAALLVLLARTPVGYAAAFIFSALGYACHSGAYDALVYDDLQAQGKKETFTRVMGVINAIYLAGSSIAALAGGLLAQRALTLLYTASITVDVLAVLLLIPLREQRERLPREHARLDLGRDLRLLAGVLRQPRLAGLLLLWAVVGALDTSFRFYGQSMMRASAISLPAIGLVGTLGNLLAIAPTWLVHKAEARYGSRRPLFLCSALVPCLIILAGLAAPGASMLRQGILILSLLTVNVLMEGAYPLFSSAVNALIPSEQRATALSSGSMLFSLVMIVVFPLIGVCGDKFGLGRGLALAGGGMLLLGAGAMLWLKVRKS